MAKILKNKRSMTGHPLLPATHPGSSFDAIPSVPAYSLFTWTFGRGSVVSSRYPAQNYAEESDKVACVRRYGESGQLSCFTPSLLLVHSACIS